MSYAIARKPAASAATRNRLKIVPRRGVGAAALLTRPGPNNVGTEIVDSSGNTVYTADQVAANPSLLSQVGSANCPAGMMPTWFPGGESVCADQSTGARSDAGNTVEQGSYQLPGQDLSAAAPGWVMTGTNPQGPNSWTWNGPGSPTLLNPATSWFAPALPAAYNTPTTTPPIAPGPVMAPTYAPPPPPAAPAPVTTTPNYAPTAPPAAAPAPVATTPNYAPTPPPAAAAAPAVTTPNYASTPAPSPAPISFALPPVLGMPTQYIQLPPAAPAPATALPTQSPTYPTVTLNNLSRPGQSFQVGDLFQLSISGAPPNVPITDSATQNGTSLGTTSYGTTDASGNFSTSGTFQPEHAGDWVEIWSIGGNQLPAVAFTVIDNSSAASSDDSTTLLSTDGSNYAVTPAAVSLPTSWFAQNTLVSFAPNGLVLLLGGGIVAFALFAGGRSR